MGVKAGYVHCINLFKLHGYYVAPRAGAKSVLAVIFWSGLAHSPEECDRLFGGER